MRRSLFFRIFGGFLVWAAAFLVLYGLQATGCRLGWDAVMVGSIPLLRLALVATLLTTAGLVLFTTRLARAPAEGEEERSHALEQVAVFANGAAALALFSFGGVFWLSLC